MHARHSLLALTLAFNVATAVQGQPSPYLVNITPAQDSTVAELTFINVIFDESVVGVNASDLLINGAPATRVATNNPNDYAFYFPQPPTGAVQLAWALNHGITNPLGSPFAGESWTYTLDTNAIPAPKLIISEFMADNAHGIQDEDGSRSDWIEIFNRGPVEANLSGWLLTDNRLNLTQWRFPSGLPLLPANQYLLVWASAKNRTNPLAPLHTSFRLAREAGSFLALLDAATNIVSAFDPYPLQEADISYGRDRVDPSLAGYFATPTPGAQNSTGGAGFAPEPVFSLPSGIFTNSSLTLTLSASAGTIRYTRDGTLPTSTSTIYTGPIAISNNVTFKARVFVSGTNLLPSAVVARNFIFLDNSTRDFNSNIPILIISTEGRGMAQDVAPGQPRTKGSLALVDTFRGRSSLQATPEFFGLAEFEIFGQTSSGFPKKPYRIEIQDELTNDKRVSLLGMPAEADWRLRNPYSDRFLMGDFLAFEVFEKMGHYQLRRRMVEVFADTTGGRLNYPGDYVGVEMLVEAMEVSNNRVNLAELTPAITNEPAISGGYMFKKDKDSTGDLNFSTAGGGGFGGQALKLHEPKPRLVNNNINHPQVVWLRNYLNQFEASLYASNWLARTGTNHYSHYIDVDSFVDQHWIVEFTKQIDGYRLSNYFSKDRNGKLKDEPLWDWNLAWGNADYLDGGHTNGWYYTLASAGEHIWLRRLITGSTASTGAGDPDFCQKIADRWGQLRTNAMNGPMLLTRIDEIANMLSEAAVRNYQKYPSLVDGTTYQWPNPNGGSWHVDYVHVTNYSMIISNMKHWVEGRYNWVDSQFTRPPVLNHPGGMVSSGFALTLSGPPGAAIYYTLDGSDPRGLFGATNGLRYTGPVTITGNVRVIARARAATAWQNTWSGPTAATLYTTLPALRITELMYHPPDAPPGNTNDAENFEYIEVRNTGSTSLNLNRFRISGGVSFEFPNVSLTAGQHAVVVADVAVFQSRYGTNNPNILIAGSYTNRLDNGGERLALEGPMGEPLLDFSYDDDWYPITDGLGFSLAIVDDAAGPETWSFKSSWRPGGGLGGTPGQLDSALPVIAPVVVNEVVTHTIPLPGDTIGGDWIELHNPTIGEVDVGDWYLTDDFNTPKKYRIPSNTIIPPGGHPVFYQSNSFGLGTDGFGLSSVGDQVYLFSGNAAGELTGYYHGFDFGAQSLGASFGRHITSTGEDQFPTQIAPTPGATNAGPKVGPVVISEILYSPFDVVIGTNAWNNTEDEFIELQNASNEPVPLYDPNYPTNRWRLRDAVDFDFPPNVTLPAHGFLLVVGFDPANPSALADFRARNNVPDDVPVYGPFAGQLDNAEERVELQRPDVPEPPPSPDAGLVSYLLVERMHYLNRAPWPPNTNGIGVSLQRINPAAYGNDPVNWAIGGSTPGRPYTGGQPPVITAQPASQTVVETYGPATFSVAASGLAPLSYQWRHNGLNLNGATGPSLVLSNVQPSQAGNYQVVVLNPGGYVLSANATLYVRLLPRLLLQPTNILVRIAPDPLAAPKTNVTFLVNAFSTNPPIFYQWHKNGVPIPSATNTSLTITNVQIPDAGQYAVAVRDGIGTAFTTNAALYPLITPVWETNWVFNGTNLVAVTPTLTVASNCLVTFGARLVAGYPPPFTYEWRRGATIFATNISSLPYQFLTFLSPGNIASNQLHRLVVKNLANPTPGKDFVFYITTLMDSDGDGLPNIYESNYGFNTNSADAQWDADGDGMSNWAEYIAGTDPTNALSYLRVDLSGVSNAASLSFTAVSNRTYTVQVTDNLGNGPWSRLANFVATPTNRVEMVVDPVWLTNRIYRLVTPWQP